MKIKVCPKCGKHNPVDAWYCTNPSCNLALLVNTITELDDELVKLEAETRSNNVGQQEPPVSTEEKPSAALTGSPVQAAPKEFDCKIPDAGPLTWVEKLQDMSMMGMGRGLMRDARARIQSDSFSLTCTTSYGSVETVLSLPLSEIRSVSVHSLPVSSMLGMAFRKSLIVGTGLGVILTLIVFLKAWGNIRSDTICKGVLFMLAFTNALALLFIFLPEVLRTTSPLTQFIFRISGDRGFVLVVESDREWEIRDALKSVGLHVETPST